MKYCEESDILNINVYSQCDTKQQSFKRELLPRDDELSSLVNDDVTGSSLYSITVYIDRIHVSRRVPYVLEGQKLNGHSAR